jgi:hypothetical protein
MFDTCNYITAAHCNKLDDGCCKTMAIFLEQHSASCQHTLTVPTADDLILLPIA